MDVPRIAAGTLQSSRLNAFSIWPGQHRLPEAVYDRDSFTSAGDADQVDAIDGEAEPDQQQHQHAGSPGEARDENPSDGAGEDAYQPAGHSAQSGQFAPSAPEQAYEAAYPDSFEFASEQARQRARNLELADQARIRPTLLNLGGPEIPPLPAPQNAPTPIAGEDDDPLLLNLVV